ncbi:MAG TPA: DUF1318 domain-containing protein [Opitutaceae bacterium]
MKTLFQSLLVGVTLLLAATLQAQDLGAVRARMAQRLPQIDALKQQGALGEDNRGYLSVRENKANAGSLAAEDNRDRGVVYEAIAKQTGSTSDAVGRARAKQIAASSAPGVWLQKEDGSWYRK